MRANKEDSKAFTIEIGNLRVISDSTRKDHDKIINWIDGHKFKDGSTGKSIAFILPTKACKYARASHGGCSFCTLPTDNPWNPSDELLNALPDRCVEIFERKKKEFPELRAAKFYTSGSFLDPWELPLEVRADILKKFSQISDEIVIETRCEYVTRKQLDHAIQFVDSSKLIIAIGQESTNDEINARANNKGHTLKQFTRASNLIHEYNAHVKGYILLKPIFVSELLAVFDAINSAKEMLDLGVDSISINPCYIGKGTLMEKLFKGNEYKPPWLWSVLEVTKRIKEMGGENLIVISDPVAAGQDRGPRNCGQCDRTFREVLKEFSATQDLSLLNTLECDCRSTYHEILRMEDLSWGNGVSFIH